MKILLDECVAHRLGHSLNPFFPVPASHCGLAGIKDEFVLRGAVEQEFEVIITVDLKLGKQMLELGLPIAVISLKSKHIAYEDLEPLIPEILHLARGPTPGEHIQLRHPKSPNG